jgi:hypothetical protein
MTKDVSPRSTKQTKLRDIAQQIEMSITAKAQPNTALIDAIDEELTQIDQSATREGLLP